MSARSRKKAAWRPCSPGCTVCRPPGPAKRRREQARLARAVDEGWGDLIGTGAAYVAAQVARRG